MTTPQLAFPKPDHVHKERKPLRRSNRKRRAATYERNYGERGAAVRAMPCLLAATGECEGPIEAAHATGRKMGGVGGDRRSLYPACRKHHRKQHRIGVVTFAAIYHIDLHAEADRTARELDARGLP